MKILIAFLLTCSVTASASPKTEAVDRNVDRVALASQASAISKLESLLKKYRRTSQESVFLARLGEMYSQRAAIEFRLQKGNAKAASYRNALKRSTIYLSELVRRYPSYPEIRKAYFSRGKAFEDLEDRRSARRDYLHVVKEWPGSPESLSSYMSLASFAVDDGLHRLAVDYLHEVEKFPDDPLYPYAVYKLAWSYYNLKDLTKGLKYLRVHADYYRGRDDSADRATRENTLQDVALFYFEGFEQRKGEFPYDKALSYFESHDPGLFVGRMASRFAKLLRSHKHDDALVAFKRQMFDQYATLPETLQVANLVFDYEFGRTHIKGIEESARDLVVIYRKNPEVIAATSYYGETQELLLNSAKSLRATILKRDKKQQKLLSGALAEIYLSFTQIVPETDPRIVAAHYNLAETLYKIGRYADAARHYRWIVEHPVEKASISRKDASLRAIASYYDLLRENGTIPKSLKASTLNADQDSPAEGQLGVWISWLEEHQSEFKGSGSKEFLNFKFEAARALYSGKRIRQAISRMDDLIDQHPRSPLSPPAASLILDTYIASQDWKATHETARRFLKSKKWGDPGFGKKLYTLAGNALYKLISHDFEDSRHADVLDRMEDFENLYEAHPHYEDALFVAGQSAAQLERRADAMRLLNGLAKRFPRSSHADTALLIQARMREETYQLDDAARIYHDYLKAYARKSKLSKKQLLDVKKKTLFYSWIHGDHRAIRDLVNSRDVCTAELTDDCDRYLALAGLSYAPDSLDAKGRKDLMQRALKAPKENRPIWAAAALRQSSRLAFPDRLALVRVVAGRYDDLDPLIRYELLPNLADTIPKAFRENREAIRTYAKLRADQSVIERRIRLIREMEETAGRAVKLPWASVRAEVLAEVGGLYLDLSRELGELPAPKGLPEAELAGYKEMIQKLMLPFEDKGYDIRSKAFEVASINAIDSDRFDRVAKPFLESNPSQAEALRAGLYRADIEPLDFSLLETFDAAAGWGHLVSKKDMEWSDDEVERFLKFRFVQALKRRNWALSAYYIQEAKEKLKLPAGRIELMETTALAAAGAQSEALRKLDELRSGFDEKNNVRAGMILLPYYVNALGQKRAREVIEDLEADSLHGKVANAAFESEHIVLLAYTADWAQANIQDESKTELLRQALQYKPRAKKLFSKEFLEKYEKPSHLALKR